MPLLPKGDVKGIEDALMGKGLYESHLAGFTRKLRTGYFTGLREKEEEIEEKLS